MIRRNILITVTTYSLPSSSYDELVCTAGFLENGDWIRIYPVPLSFLIDLKGSGKVRNVKYSWIGLDTIRRSDDFRPESHSPANYDFKDITIGKTIDTAGNWALRKEICLKKVYTNKALLLEDSRAPKNVSLATFKPSKVLGMEIETDNREWKDEWKGLRLQTNLFETVKPIEQLIPKLPYKFFYRYCDDAGVESKLMIEDWEIGALYWNCLKSANGDERSALNKVKCQYEDNFIKNKDLYFFLGTTKDWHRRRVSNPFVIIGIFYPKKELQTSWF